MVLVQKGKSSCAMAHAQLLVEECTGIIRAQNIWVSTKMYGLVQKCVSCSKNKNVWASFKNVWAIHFLVEKNAKSEILQ
jgi:hypothetical protein